MRRAVAIIRALLSILGLAALVLGLLFWSGLALAFVPLHMLLGTLFVVSLWVLVGIAFVARASRGLAAVVLVWSLIVPVLGMAQVRMLPGPRHWVIESIHLLVGLIAIGLGHALSGPLSRRFAASTAPRTPEQAGRPG